MSELVSKILKGEGENLDFKFRIDDQTKIARTLCAFANTTGGSLLIGVKDNGKIVGCDPEEEYYMIEGASSIKSRPTIPFKTKVWKEGHHLVLEVMVEPQEVRCKALDDNGKWVPYYRIDDHSVRGNRVLDIVWRLKREIPARPERFSDIEIDVLKVIHNHGPVSVSSINKKVKLGFNELSGLLASLIHWGVVDISMQDDGLKYFTSDLF